MKKLLLTPLVVALLTPAVSHAAPKVYGRINLSLDHAENKNSAETQQTWRLDSNASRFGLKGEDELTPTLSAIYQIEWGIGADSGLNVNDTNSKKTNIEKLTQRNRYLGVKSMQYGALKLGKFDSYTKLAQGEIDQFNDYAGEDADMKYTLAGENRYENAIGYESPIFLKGAQFNIMGIVGDNANQPNECPQTDKLAACTNTGHGVTTGGVSTSLTYKGFEDKVYAAVSYDRHVNSVWNGVVASVATNKVPVYGVATQSDLLRLVGSYSFKAYGLEGLTLNGLYQHTKPVQDIYQSSNNQVDKEKAYLVSASYKIPTAWVFGMEGWKLKAQYQEGKTSFEGAKASDDTKIKQSGFGIDYDFSDKTRMYGFYTKRKNNGNGLDVREQSNAYYGLGMDHKF